MTAAERATLVAACDELERELRRANGGHLTRAACVALAHARGIVARVERRERVSTPNV